MKVASAKSFKTESGFNFILVLAHSPFFSVYFWDVFGSEAKQRSKNENYKILEVAFASFQGRERFFLFIAFLNCFLDILYEN